MADIRRVRHGLMKRARNLYQGEVLAVDLDATVFALDSTTIDLCLARFPWTPSQQSKAAVKMHVLLNLRCNIPAHPVFGVMEPQDRHDDSSCSHESCGAFMERFDFEFEEFLVA